MKPLAVTVAVIVGAAVVPFTPAAQMPLERHRQVSSYYPREIFAARRKALAARLGDGIALIAGASRPDRFVPFRQNNTFFYLTGVTAPGAVLWINGSDGRSTMFLPEGRELSDEGPQLIPNVTAIGQTGLDNVTATRWLYLSIASRPPTVVYTMATPEELGASGRDAALRAQADRVNSGWNSDATREAAFVRRLQEWVPTVPVRDLTPLIDEMRWVKDAEEIRALREAGRIGVEGMSEAIRASRPGLVEHELADVARYVFMRRGAQGEAYFPVVASGPNSVFTHYSDNARVMQPNDLVVMDFAPDFQYQTVDITRTWPISGKFTDEQMEYYETILEAHKAMIAAIKPGVTVKMLGSIAREIYARHGMADRYPGGIGHFIGMSAHDPGPYDRPFVPGVVFNVEPMIGVPEKGWHFRIEDTVLVTEAGHEILTTGLPWEMHELNALRDRGSRLEPGKPGSGGVPPP